MTVQDQRLAEVQTPALLLDEVKMTRNIDQPAAHVGAKGAMLRPHLKTAKSTDVARRVLTGGTGPATVSTLAEAEVFADMGVRDIIYAVGITPDKLPRGATLRDKGGDLSPIHT